jgi:hypothetical protein
MRCPGVRAVIEEPEMRHLTLPGYRSFLIALVLLLVLPAGLSWGAVAAQPAAGAASIQVTKRTCAGITTFPIFVESHCTEVPDASFALTDPANAGTQTLTAGQPYTPDDASFAGDQLWSLEDVSPGAATTGVRVVSCLEATPETGWQSSVSRVVHSEVDRSVLIDWMATDQPRPSLTCIWLELPDFPVLPAVLSLQVFTAETPYLNWTELTGAPLPDLPRGESGEDLEAAMVMTNSETGDIYSFAADAYGQVLVPAGTYSLVDSASGLEEFFTMVAGDTTLVEIGLAGGPVVQPQGSPEGAASVPPAAETGVRTFTTGVLYCDDAGCAPVVDAVISYASEDGTVQGSCVTAQVEGPNGVGAWCEYEYVPGVPTVLTLEASSLPAEWVVTSENPQTYLVPENPDGELGPVYFQVGPA